MTTRRMNTSMTYSDARVYDNGDIRMSHYDLRIRKRAGNSWMRMYEGYASQESYLLTFAIVFVNLIADTTRLSSLGHKIMHERYILLASHIISI